VPITSLKKSNRFIKVHIKPSKPGVKRIIRITDNADLIINGEDAYFYYSVYKTQTKTMKKFLLALLPFIMLNVFQDSVSAQNKIAVPLILILLWKTIIK
jgi:hypothetical protein